MSLEVTLETAFSSESNSAFDLAFEKVGALVRLFQKDEAYFLSSKYQESEARKDFIDKFWIALGWDVHHDTQTNPREQEVKIERGDSISTRKADYAFYLKPDYQRPQFLVEAKKPSVQLAQADFYFQTARYGFNTSTSVSVLTSFREFHIIDCRRKPANTEGIVSSAFLKSYDFTEYLDREKFMEIYWVFSHEAVAQGELKLYRKGLKSPKGKTKQLKLIGDTLAPVDDQFLAELDEYRKTLASAFKKSNPELSSEELTEAAQKVLDRLVFIRFLEDKTIEPDFIIDTFCVKGASWARFIKESRALDKKYNGVVFKEDFIDRPQFVQPDDAKFFNICDELSHQNSPYLFSYIPVEILGSIYERFLGKVVVAKGRGIAVEEKPEVRKAGGVYYTPKYIVDYIVENTVGKILNPEQNPTVWREAPASRPIPNPSRSDIDQDETGGVTKEALHDTQSGVGLAPKEVAKLRFADIACGSGSFLIAMFDRVVQHLESWYNAHPAEAKKAKCRRGEGDTWVLSLEQKRRILQENIYGVDIDHQAVEVAQFSLFLKLLESETIATTQAAQTDLSLGANKKILPDLSKNILCGNSLVEYDIAQLFPLTEEEEAKIKPFSFKQEFKDIMAGGGFDAIVGNPPYVRQELISNLKLYFKKSYTVYHNSGDLYTYFVERAVSLMRNGGYFGYIIANKWMRANYGLPLRLWLKRQNVNRIIDFGDHQVFRGATTYPCILTIVKGKAEGAFHATNVASLNFERLDVYVNEHEFEVATESLDKAGWTLNDAETYSLIEKIALRGKPLGEYVDNALYRGILTGLNEAFVIDGALRKKIIESHPKCNELIKPFLAGREVHRYELPTSDRFLILIPNGWTNEHKQKGDAWTWFKSEYTPIAEHLQDFAKAANERWDKGEYWWELRPCDYYDKFELPRIILPAIIRRASYTFSDSIMYSNDKTSIISTSDKYLLAILNSPVADYFVHSIASTKQGGFFEYKPMYVSKIPIPSIDLDNHGEKQKHDALETLSNQMLEIKKRLAQPLSESQRDQLQRKCDYFDNEIDRIVYELYDLTEEEIWIVEGAIE
jgi:type I restriction-modification system DNA methylase subunit